MGKSHFWSFAGYISEAGGRVVQEWYDSLPVEGYEELQDLLNHMAVVENWTRPAFDKVAHPLHEIRAKAAQANHQVRIYGVFDGSVRHRFIFLHGVTAKKKGHDRKGQEVALKRLALLKQGKASTHEFLIESRLD